MEIQYLCEGFKKKKKPYFENWKIYVRNILILFMSGFFLSSYAIEKETQIRLTGENRVISSALELHLTATDSAMINSTVSLNHEDAWLFFDNIRPSDVIARYRKSIFIGESALNPGGNGRVAIYKHGTVVMPHGYSFSPLTVYTGNNFSGESKQLEIETYHNNLGDFDNAIQSFKLKRGYMATFANSADGTGYSRVFIANDEDIEFNLPDLLINKVSFIRVFKYEWVTKKGWVGWDPSEATLDLTNSTWYYSWNAFKNSTQNTEFVPMRSKLTYPGWAEINGKTNVSHMLSFNEPDHGEQHQDDNGGKPLTVAQALEQMPDHLKSGLRIGAPATTDFNWVIDFVNKCDELNYRVDYVAVHAYWGNNPSSYLNSLRWVHNATGRPIWITEWNYGANWTNEWWPNNTWELTPANEEYAYQKIKAIVDFFDQTPWIERYSIYNWVEDKRAIILNGELTKAGEYYAGNNSAEAFSRRHEVIPHWNYVAPELSYRYFSLRNSMRLSWTNDNGELIQQYILKKKVNNGEYETVFSTDDFSKVFYLDPLDSVTGGNVSWRMTNLTARGEQLNSNEISYIQATGDNEFQFGTFSVDNPENHSAYFSQRFKSKPVTILGIPEFKNPVPLTQRINFISTSTYMFFVKPWSYLNNPKLTESDLMSSMTMQPGNYNFEGLKAEAQFVENVNREWKTINFSQKFEKIPAVFATIISSSNPYPLAVGVRNVSTSGFEISLKSEEAITKTLSPETINYLAIEPGQGVIKDKRVTVGRNFDGNKISSDAVEIPYDTTYDDPVIFAGLLSDENLFASTLRFSNSGNHTFQISRQREMSVGESEILADDFGWMVMDLAADQPDISTGLDAKVLRSFLEFYPNPADNFIHFKFDVPKMVKILDMSGQIIFESRVSESLDVSRLPAGTYILNAEGYKPKRLVKTK